MSSKPWWFRLFLNVLLVDLLIATVVVAWSWFTADFGTVSLSNRFFVCGMAVIVIGIFSVFGYKIHIGSGSIAYAQSVSNMNLAERTRQMISEINRGYGFALLMIASGGLAILAAVLIA